MFANRNVFHRFAFIALSISKYLQLNLNETHLLFGGSQLQHHALLIPLA
jgi:hypothetical protein